MPFQPLEAGDVTAKHFGEEGLDLLAVVLEGQVVVDIQARRGVRARLDADVASVRPVLHEPGPALDSANLDGYPRDGKSAPAQEVGEKRL